MRTFLYKCLSAWRKAERPIKFSIAWLLALTVGPRMVRIGRGSYRLWLHPSNLAVQFWTYPERRREEERFIASLLRKGDHVIDIGANIGSVTCLAAMEVGPRGSVLAIEAHPKTASHLRDNIRLNHLTNVTVVEMAADEYAGTVHFDSRTADDRNAVTQDADGIEVVAGRIDGLALSKSRYRLLKIDVEGYELPALRGAQETLGRVDGIWFECDRVLMEPFGYRPADLLAFLWKQGYRIYRRTDHQFIEVEAIDDDCHVDLLATRSINDFTRPPA